MVVDGGDGAENKGIISPDHFFRADAVTEALKGLYSPLQWRHVWFEDLWIIV